MSTQPRTPDGRFTYARGGAALGSLDEVVVGTQDELDQALELGASQVRLDGEGTWMVEGGQDLTVQASEGVVLAYGSCHVVATGRAEVSAYDAVTVTARDAARVRAFGTARVVASGWADVVTWDGASATAVVDTARVRAGEELAARADHG